MPLYPPVYKDNGPRMAETGPDHCQLQRNVIEITSGAYDKDWFLHATFYLHDNIR